MAFILKDRVKEYTLTTGTGAVSLEGSSETFDSFQSYMTNGDTTYYAIITSVSGTDEWEVGLGTWNTGNTITRTTVLSGSNGTNAVNFGAGKKDVFMTYPSDKAVYTDANGNIDINGGAIDGAIIGAAQAAASNFTTVDATGNVTVGGQLDVDDWIDLAAQASHPAHGEGRLWYDNVHKTLNYYSDDAGVVHELGIEEHARVYNETGATLSKGTPVYFAGTKTSNGTYVPTVAAANATSSTKYKSEGMIAADITNNSYGYIITAGRLEGIDTSHLSVGQFFTGITDGATQTAAPVYPNFPMCLGFVVRSDATNGVAFLAQQNHSIKSFRVQMDQHIGGSLTIDGDLNVTGSTNTTSTSDVTAGAPFYRANEGDAIGDANTTFTGSGLDDAFFAGHFTGTVSTNYYVKIDGVGTPDTFAVSTDNFTTTITTGNAITGSEQMIHSADNISVKFGTTTGHTLNDVWTGTAAPTNVDTGFFSNRNTGTSGVGYTHMGLFYDASESKWRLVDEYDPVPAGTINTGHSSYATGTIVANLEGNVTGNITGNVSGNAATASALETARNIGGVAFNGTANINLPGVNAAGNQNTTGNAATATALATARTVQLSGDVTGSATFDGSANINITTVVQDDSHAHVISNVDGLQTALDAKTNTSRQIISGDGLTGGGDFTANRTLAVGAGTGITVNANNVAIDSSYTGFDGRYYTETEADSRYVNVTGDTITGSVNIETTGGPALTLKDTDGSGTNAAIYIDFDDSAGNRVGYVGIGSGSTNDNWFYSTSGSPILSSGNGTAPKYYNGSNSTYYDIFHDGYHPNADKWTDARTLSLSGDASGSVSWDGSANATLSVTVADNSHSHSNYLLNTTDTLDGVLTVNSTADAQILLTSTNSWTGIGFNDSGGNNEYIWHNGSNGTFAIGGNGSNIAGKKLHVNGGMSVGVNAAATSTPTNGIYSEGAISVGGSTVWHSGNDGSGSGLDADTVDGIQASDFIRYSTNMTGTLKLDDQKIQFASGSGSGSTFSASHYSMGVDIANGSWTSTNYSDLIIGYHTGIRIGAGYSGIRFYDNSPTTDTNNTGNGNGGEELLMTIGGGGTSASGAHVTVHNNLTVQDDINVGNRSNFGSDTATADEQNNVSMFASSPSSNVAQAGAFHNKLRILGGSGQSRDLQLYQVDSEYAHIGSSWSSNRLVIDSNLSQVNFNQAITTTSTIDGRDVAADGTKLDAIDDNANNYSFPYTVSASASNSTVVQRHSSGYIFANYFNTTPNTVTSGVTQICVETGNDGYIRHGTAAAVRSFINVANGANNYSLPATPSVTSLNVADKIIHTGDIDTYTEFHAGDQWRVVTGGIERFEVNNTTVTSVEPIYAPSFHGDGSNLTGISSGLPLSGGTLTGDLSIPSKLIHAGDTDTYTRFNSDEFSVYTGGTERVKINNTYAYFNNYVTAPYFSATSDINLKTDIKKIVNPLEMISNLNGYTFNWKESGEASAGVIAQEVEKVLPSAISENKEGSKSVNYNELIGVLIEAVKEQQVQIDSLKSIIGKA